MKNRPLKYGVPIRATFLGVLLAVTMTMGPAHRLLASETDSGTMSEPIHITADRLVTDIEAHSARFSGNVHAIQGDTQMRADQLTVYYRPDGKAGQKEATGTIERITARGHVRITFDNRLAESQQAVYITSERKLTLEGPGSKVTSGQDEIVGSKITYYRDDGRVAIEGDDQNRVKAVFHADQKGLN